MLYELSVIIPVYNTEKYLNKTLNSVCNQSIFDKIEIIIVDDGSIDNSLEICNSFASKHSNIKVFSQSNKGVSAARNLGIRKATGKYITFLDSDDYIYENLYEKELEFIVSTKAEIGIIDFFKQHPNGKTIKYRKNFYKEWANSNESIKSFFAGVIGNQIFDKIFLTKIVKNIEFPNGIKIGEDMWFVFSALLSANKVVMNSSIAGYVYIIRESSAMNGKFDDKYFEPVLLSDKMCSVFAQNKELYEYAYAHSIHEKCKVLEYVYRHKAEEEYEKKVKELKSELHNYSLKNGCKYLIRRQFLGYLLMRISPKFYLFMHKLLNIG